MCGVAGVLSFLRREDHSARVRRMLQRIRHRGPEEFCLYIGQGVGLGHARLSIIDLASGQQPMCNDDGTKWIIFNGEIFNFVEIRNDLVARGHRFRTGSDTEVLLRHFEENGPEGLKELNGQFAFAVWDARERTLFLARDRVGICPLFYTFHDGDFLFASEIKAIFADPRIPRELDPVALDDVFTFWFTLAPATVFKGIFELPPAHWMTVTDSGTVRVQRYWDLPECDDAACGAVREEANYAEELRELLVDATRIRLRADVPVGAYLSGGLDSSVTAGIVRSFFPENELRTFSVRFVDKEFDEGDKQKLMSRHLGTRHDEIICRGGDIAGIMEKVVWHAETALLRTAPAPMFLLSRLVRERGFKVVLTGEGADEILAGYDIFKEAKVRRFIEASPGSAMRPLLLRRLYPYLVRSPAQAAAYAKRFFLAPPDPFGREWISHAPRWNMTSMAKTFFSEGLREELKGHESATARISDLLSRSEGNRTEDPMSWAQRIEFKTLLPGYLLSSQGDRMLMGNSVEGDSFLDHPLSNTA
jgi:asparagine synthase (glutamine-hydrolysing)